MSYKGIDVSHYNAPIDWSKVKGQIDFAILKMGNIGDSRKFWLDDTFEKNYAECKKYGIPIGVYLYCYSNDPANARAAGIEVAKYLENKSLELPVYIDMEDNEIKPEGKKKLTDIVIAFNTEIEKAGKWAGVYANLDWFKNYLDKKKLIPRFTSWIAHVDNTKNQNKYEGKYDMFQYSWKGKINGITGNNGDVDMNILYRDLLKEINPNITQSPTPAKKSVDEIAGEVINGQWGNGEDRKNRLTNAGYNYGEVQNKVNQLLKSNQNEYYKACNQNEKSIVDALASIGVNNSFQNRKKIAAANGVYDYIGSYSQNERLLVRLKAGRLKKAW